MSGDFLARFSGRLTAPDAKAHDDDLTQDLGAFGWLPDPRQRAVMLELRKKDGNILAVGYGWLEKAEFDPSQGITLHMAGGPIRITGQNLNGEILGGVRLFRGIAQHRVVWIQEAPAAVVMRAGKTVAVIDRIAW
jgi:hypothetical protein